MSKDISIWELEKLIPDEDTCLGILFDLHCAGKVCERCRYPKFHRVKRRPCFECGECGYQIYPKTQTMMRGSRMSIRHWFYAAHHFAQSKNSVSSSEMASYLGINQKSAFLLLNTLRILVAYTNKQERFTGIIEIDVTYIGGKKKAPRNAEKKIGHNGQENKTIVFGMRERRTGKVRTFIVSRESKEETLPIIQANVEIGSIIHSDEAAAYKCLPMYGYSHEFVNHKKFEWKRGNVTIQPIEGFWSDIKRSIRGTHIWVSKDYMREYLNEYEFRHNNCDKSVRECWIILIGLLLNAPPSAVQEVLFSRYKP